MHGFTWALQPLVNLYRRVTDQNGIKVDDFEVAVGCTVGNTTRSNLGAHAGVLNRDDPPVGFMGYV